MNEIKKIEALFNRAVQFHQNSQFNEATKLYTEILKINPRHFDALQLLATLHAHVSNYSASIELFAQAVKVNGNNPKVLNNYGYVLAQTGDLINALNMYERAVRLDSNYVDALNNLANLYQQIGDTEKSILLYDRVIELNENYVQAYFNKGIALQKVSRFFESLQSYDQALNIKPDYVDALLNKATVLKELGQYEEALNIYKQLLDLLNGPQAFDIHNNYGNLLQTMGRFEDALASFDKAVIANPYPAITYSNRANVLQQLSRYPEAILSYGVALTLDPNNAEFYNNRGNALQKSSSFELALNDYVRSTELNPELAQSYYNRGNLFKLIKKPQLAIESYKKAIYLYPYYSDAYNNLGNVFKDLNLLDDALSAYDNAVKVNPIHLDAVNNKGVTLQRLQDLDGACACFDAAIKLNPNATKSYVNKAIVQFLQGNLIQAWLSYEKRIDDSELIPKPLVTANPLFTASDLNHALGTRLLIWAEQGVGDSVMFGSVLNDIRRHVKELIVMLDLRLISLFQRSFPEIIFLDNNISVDNSSYDSHLPMASLGHVLQMDETRIKSLPPNFLKVDSIESDALRSQILQLMQQNLNEANTNKIICGISWESNNPSNGVDRSLELEYFIESIKVPGVRFVNLQYVVSGSPDLNIEKLKKYAIVCTDVDNYADLDRFTALINACDVIISIDNSTVHLSAAIGKPTWVLLPLIPDWRWMLDREDSPWYPSVQLFRQMKWGDWSVPLAEIKTKLVELVSSSAKIK